MKKLTSLLIILLLFTAGKVSSPPSFIVVIGWESGVPRQNYFIQDLGLCNPPDDAILDNTRFHSGASSLRLTLENTYIDCQGSPRTDMKFPDNLTYKYFDFWIFLDSSYLTSDPNPELFFQIHHRDQGADTIYKVVPMGHWIVNNKYQIQLAFYPNGANTSLPENGPTKVTGDSSGSSNPSVAAKWTPSNDVWKWTHWTYEFIPSTSADGLWRIYKNGELFYQRLGPNWDLGLLSWYAKIGIYKWRFKRTPISTVSRRRWWLDDLKVGTASNTINDFITTVDVPLPSITFNTTNATCFGGTGSATASVSSCSGLCSYVWSDGTLGPTLSNKPAGTYTVQVTDGFGRKITGTVTITQPTQVKAFASIGMVSGGAAPVTITGSGGTGTKTGTGTFSQLQGSTMEYTVTDAVGCQGKIKVSIPKSGKVLFTAPGILKPKN